MFVMSYGRPGTPTVSYSDSIVPDGDAGFPSLCREGEESFKKQLGRVLSIWQERAVYENSLLDQLSQVLCKDTHSLLIVYDTFLFMQTHFLSLTGLADGEKKAKKRSYEKIQMDEEDNNFASQSSPTEEPPQVPCDSTLSSVIRQYLFMNSECGIPRVNAWLASLQRHT